MKRFFQFFLSFFGLSLIFFSILEIISYYFLRIFKTLTLIEISLLFSILILILFRNFIFYISNYLLKIYLSIFSSILFVNIFNLFLFGSSFNIDNNLLLIILFSLGFLIFFFLSMKKTIITFYSLIFLIIFSFVILFIFSEMQKAVLRKYEKKFEEIGFTFDLKEFFPSQSSKQKCGEFLEKIRVFSNEKDEKWGSFYNNFALKYNEKEFLNVLKEGRNPKEEILRDEKNKDKFWEEFYSYNQLIKDAMEKCPYIQFIEPEEYIEKVAEKAKHDILPLVRFARILFSSSVILRAEGKDIEADEKLLEIYNVKEKLKIKGQPIISPVVYTTMERIYLIGEALSILIDKKPLSDEKLERIEKISKGDLSFLLSSYNFELWPFFKSPKSYSLDGKVMKKIPEFVLRAFLYKVSKRSLEDYYKIYSFLSKEVNFKENKFLWKEYREFNLRKKFFFPDLGFSPYGRILATISQARALLLSNEIIKFYLKNKKLPENIDFLNKDNFIDPFNEKPLIYKKLNDKKFLVYSVFYNEIDDGGKNLYISDVISFKDELKEDIGFIFSLE